MVIASILKGWGFQNEGMTSISSYSTQGGAQIGIDANGLVVIADYHQQNNDEDSNGNWNNETNENTDYYRPQRTKKPKVKVIPIVDASTGYKKIKMVEFDLNSASESDSSVEPY